MDESIDGRSLHVVILGDWLPFPHGLATTGRVVLTARALKEAGADVRVMCLQAADRASSVKNTAVRGEADGIPFEYTSGTTVRNDSFVLRRLIAAWGWLHGAARLIRLRRDGRLDAVLLWFWTPRPALHLLCFTALLRALGVAVVREVNESPWPQKPDATALERALSPLAGMDGAMTISTDLYDWAARVTSSRRHFRIIDVPILVDVHEQEAGAYPTTDPLVVFAGSPVYRATIRFIFDAMREVWRLHPACRLVVTGAAQDDPDATWLWEEVREAELAGRVELVGFLPRRELLHLYARAHALLIPLFDDQTSRARFPTKIGEYLAAARPVVTSSVGEIPNYFTDGVDAVVCEPSDPAAFGRGVISLLDDPERAAQIGRRGRVLAEQEFHYALYGDVLASAFTELALGRGV